MNNQNQTQVQIDVNVAKGVYSNMMEVKHSTEEFCIDFFNIFPPVGALASRVIISPGHLKRMIKALQDNLKKYEEKSGKIEEAPEPEKPRIGFGSN